MDPVAAKYIGAGIACIGMGGAGVGVGTIFGNYLAAALRNPSAAQGQFGNLIFGFAVTEALGIFSLLIALLLLFAPSDGERPEHHDDRRGHQARTPKSPGGGRGRTFRRSRRRPSRRSSSGSCSIFVALYLLMSRLALPRVGGIMRARASSASKAISPRRKRLKDESDAAIAAYEKALADARGRAQALANETREKYAAEAEARRKALEAKLNARIAEAEKTIAATTTPPWPTSRHRGRGRRGDRRAADRHRAGRAPTSPTRSPTRSSAEDRR